MKQVTAAIIIRDGKVLLTRRKQGESLAGFWEFPGGKIEKGETPQECLERELKEELGLNTCAGDLLTECVYHYVYVVKRFWTRRVNIQRGFCLNILLHNSIYKFSEAVLSAS